MIEYGQSIEVAATVYGAVEEILFCFCTSCYSKRNNLPTFSEVETGDPDYPMRK